MGEALHAWAMGQTCTLKRGYHDIRQRRGSIVAVFSRVARTTSPLQLSHCLITHLILWLVKCPVPAGSMKDSMLHFTIDISEVLSEVLHLFLLIESTDP